MLDLFGSHGVPPEKIEELTRVISTDIAVIYQLLVIKGICTEAEILQMQGQMIAQVELCFQAQKEKTMQERREENPR